MKQGRRKAADVPLGLLVRDSGFKLGGQQRTFVFSDFQILCHSL